MTITKSNVAQHIIKHTQSEVGTLHFFNHIAVMEFEEGVHMDLISFGKTMKDIVSYFGTTKPFGLLSNRVNSYSVDILDIDKVQPLMPNMAAYGIVTHNEAGRMNAVIESNFCKSTDICFDNLYEGLDTVYNRVKDRMSITLLTN